jgi:hypothetical protein
MTDLHSRVRDLIRQELRPQSSSPEAGPAPELLPSSFVDKIYLCIAVEEEFDLAFKDAQFIECQTIADVCSLVDRQLGHTA